MKMQSIDIWMMVDEYGNYVVSSFKRALHDCWLDEIGCPPTTARTIKITVDAELPRSGIMSVEAPAAVREIAVTEEKANG